ncbi:hypothetical protein FJTKL_11673 [Diaporthe vaccinii]|uniref:Uncharacterized protein n=1 Tax=Diaporthe vaccinii TaxID=105482 RepID=A0ABR4EFK1_9PEZI
MSSLNIEDLDPSLDFDDSKSAGRWFIGSGQRIAWRGCFVWEYTSGSVDEPVKKHNTCDGQATIPPGVEVYIGGKDGVLKLL